MARFDLLLARRGIGVEKKRQKQGFVKVAISRDIRLREGPLIIRASSVNQQ